MRKKYNKIVKQEYYLIFHIYFNNKKIGLIIYKIFHIVNKMMW